MQKTHYITKIFNKLLDYNIQPGDLIVDRHSPRVFIVLKTGPYDIILCSRSVWCLTDRNTITKLFAD
jgi:hypothetical protein